MVETEQQNADIKKEYMKQLKIIIMILILY